MVLEVLCSSTMAHQDDEPPVAGRRVELQQRLFDQRQHAVDEDLPDVAQPDAADEIRHKEHGAEYIGALDAPREQQRDGKGQHVDENGGHGCEAQCEPERAAERGVRKRFDIIGNAHPSGVAHRGEFAEGEIDKEISFIACNLYSATSL